MPASLAYPDKLKNDEAGAPFGAPRGWAKTTASRPSALLFCTNDECFIFFVTTINCSCVAPSYPISLASVHTRWAGRAKHQARGEGQEVRVWGQEAGKGPERPALAERPQRLQPQAGRLRPIKIGKLVVLNIYFLLLSFVLHVFVLARRGDGHQWRWCVFLFLPCYC